MRRPLGKLLDKASLTRLDTELVVRPRPNIPLLIELAVLRELLALVDDEDDDVAPEALLLATAANVSSRDTADDSVLEEADDGADDTELGS